MNIYTHNHSYVGYLHLACLLDYPCSESKGVLYVCNVTQWTLDPLHIHILSNSGVSLLTYFSAKHNHSVY